MSASYVVKVERSDGTLVAHLRIHPGGFVLDRHRLVCIDHEEKTLWERRYGPGDTRGWADALHDAVSVLLNQAPAAAERDRYDYLIARPNREPTSAPTSEPKGTPDAHPAS